MHRHRAVRCKVAKGNLPFRPGIGRMEVKSRSGGEGRTDAMARQNQRKAQLVLAVVCGCLVLCRKDSGREQEGNCEEGSHDVYIATARFVSGSVSLLRGIWNGPRGSSHDDGGAAIDARPYEASPAPPSEVYSPFKADATYPLERTYR